ncbi:hypothetical protein Tco_0732480 [Tanacetum coccineum]
MDDPNMTMEEYIKFEEEKARRRVRVSVEAEFPAIVIDDTVMPQDALQCKSQVSITVNDEIDFRISFDESDDENYTIICDLNSFSYKMISVNNLKTDSENDNEKVGIPSFPPPKPTTNYIDDLDFFNDFENKFPAIVYNDAQTSKSDMALPPRRIYRREVHRVPVFDFGGLPHLMAEGLSAKMLMEDQDDQGVSLFTSRAWRRLFDIRGSLVHELILEFYSMFRFGQAILDLETPKALQFQLGGARRRLHGLVDRSITDQTRFSTWVISCMTQLMEASRQPYQAFDGTFRGSSPTAFERRTRRQTGEASTSTT